MKRWDVCGSFKSCHSAECGNWSWNASSNEKESSVSIRRHRLTTTFFFILFAFGMLAASVPAMANPLNDSLKGQAQEKLVNMGVADVQVDLNIQIPMTKAENPVGYDRNLWATAIYHKSPIAGTTSIKRPTILLVTAYRRELMGLMSLLAFVPDDYNIVMVDMRGTGSGEGVWGSLDPTEHYDVAYVIDKWIPSQPWSDGKVGMVGGSYMAILQYPAAGLVEQVDGVPTHLKVIMPMSALSVVYKDIVMHGGNFEMEFMAVWITITDLLTIFPPALMLGGVAENGINITDIQKSVDIWGQHFNQLAVPIGWIMDPSHETKGRWYEEKSPMIYWPQKPAGGWNLNGSYDRVGLGVIPKNLPVFTATGWFDIFTRGSFLNYEYGLKNHSASNKSMIVGPWYHVDAAMMYPGVTGLGLAGKNGLLTWDIARRWMDWKIKGKNDPFMQQFPVLLYVLGEEKWRGEKSWPLAPSRLTEKTYYLSKAKPSLIFGDWFGVANLANNYKLVPSVTTTDYNNVTLFGKTPKTNPVLYHNPAALNGVMSRSAQRWFGFSPLTMITQMSKYVLNIKDESLIPWEDERNDETGVLTFTTEPLTSDLEISGPLKLTFWAKTKFTAPAIQAAVNQFLAQIRLSLISGPTIICS